MKKYLLTWEYTDENGVGLGMEYGSVSGEFNTLREGKDCLRKLTRLTGGKLKYRLWIASKALTITSGTENSGLKPLTFYDWMLKTHAGCRAPGAHLADLMKKDKAFTKNNTKEGILDYLYFRNACWHTLEVFKKCWASYRRSKSFQQTAVHEERLVGDLADTGRPLSQ